MEKKTGMDRERERKREEERKRGRERKVVSTREREGAQMGR
jgi:hypothetical protein